ncbi:MAG TPA: GNAT family N-acetyltransferase [Bacillota bacterium]|jgi:ribosomal protein S18 acetylase RimI-like enzyme|nr:GNAT family N-acetyltransferase [Bacillota bacterium]HOL10725.1 GNAT family N-acetyltransferase [Bacillota bacterium]HPO98399.1 GNAT family N-acetyltransferase [Bacillota bacterium]
MDEKIVIREIISNTELEESLEVIRNSFLTVAEELNLTKENCPTNPAFVEFSDLKVLRDKGVWFYGLFVDEVQIGFVAVEKANEEVYYLEKLAVLPQYRHRGYGRRLMDFVSEQVKSWNGRKLSIGIINENERLKRWYQQYGFVEQSQKRFPHLPFTVCFMEKLLEEDFAIHEMTEADLNAVSSFYIGLIDHIKEQTQDDYFNYDRLSETEIRKQFREALLKPAVKTYIAKDGTKPIGFIKGEIRDCYLPFSKVKKIGYIESAFLLPEYRRKGIMRQLELKMVEFFKGHGITYVELNIITKNSVAKGTWESLGYVTFREQMRKKI